MTDPDPNYDRRERIFVALASLASLACLGLNLTAHFTGDSSGDYSSAVFFPFLLPVLILIHFPFQKWDRRLAWQFSAYVGIILFFWLSPFDKLFLGLWLIFAFWIVIVHHRCLRAPALQLPFIFFSLGIAFCGNWLQVDNQKYINYARWISLSVIQFGDIDGDGKTDLITSGYKGMVGGNPRWYRGNGKDFGEWEGNRCFATGQSSPLMVELNGDGQIDMIDGRAQINQKGGFGAGPAIQYGDTESMMFDLGIIKRPSRSLYFHADLDGDRIEEIFALLDSSLECCWRENGVWKTRSFPAPALFDLFGKHLSLSSDASVQLLAFLKSKSWPMKICPLPPPVANVNSQNAGWNEFIEKHLIDFDGDGLDELAVCTVDEVKIYRQKDGQFREASTLKHSGEPLMLHRDYFFWIEQFGDLNGDGRIDFLSQEGEVFLCDKDLQFHSAGKLPVRLPSRERDRCKLLLFDINGDGKLDVISSYQPWKSVILGPLAK